MTANLVSVMGLIIGAIAAACYAHFTNTAFATLGFVLTLAWLVADGLDGMIARATKTASAVGRVLDGMCDHGVFLLIYLALAFSIGTVGGFVLMLGAIVAHAVQSNFYESERTRFHRRLRGDSGERLPERAGDPFERAYDLLAGSLARLAEPFDTALRRSGDPVGMGQEYGRRAVPPMRLLSLLSANMRVIAIYLACLAGDPRLFFWFEVVPLTGVAVAGIFWHRRIEGALAGAGHGFKTNLR